MDFKRLQTAIEWSIQQLEEPRRQRTAAIRQYCGSHYSAHAADKAVPVNLLELAVTIYVRHLAARAPAVMVSTSVDELRPVARNMELALNQIPKEIGLESTLRKAVVHALFGMGIVKVGIASGGSVVAGHDVGEPFVDLVSPDDYFLDMTAKSMEAIKYEGNDYWLDLDAARELGDGKQLEPDKHTVQAHEGGAMRAEGLSIPDGGEHYEDQVALRDVWLPKRGELVTYAIKSKQVLRVVPWDGPDHGPYHLLHFTDVPDNLLPLPPVALWRDLHELCNTLFRKLAKQAVEKKRVVAFPGGNDDSVKALQNAKDGDGIKYTGQKPEAVDLGGIDAETLAFFLQSRDLASYMGGNLDILGGLAPGSETASQDRLMADAGSVRMAGMKASTISFSCGIFESLAWYEWTDPVRVRTVEKPSSRGDFLLRSEWSAETRDGDFLDFNLDINPFSLDDDTPSTKLAKLKAALLELIFPAMPMIQQSGGQLDGRRLVELIAKLSGTDEIREVVKFGEPILGDPQQGGDAMPSFRPGTTTRNYVRTNRPGATRSGKDDVMARGLLGIGAQASEKAALGRLTS